MFASEDAMKEARNAGILGAFKHEISALYGHCGSDERPFDTELAVHVEYECGGPPASG